MVYLLKFREPVGRGKKFVRYYMGYCDMVALMSEWQNTEVDRGQD